MSALLSSTSAAEYAETLHGVVDMLARRVKAADKPFSGASRKSLQRVVDEIDLDAAGSGTSAALEEVERLYVENAVWFHHPAYVAHLNCPVAIPAIAAEAMLAAINTSVDTYDQSTIGTLMEQKLVTWTAGRIGFTHGDGIFTSGGTQSNLQALLLAREHSMTVHLGSAPSAADRAELATRMLILATDESHFSVQKAARILGLGDEAVLSVPTDSNGRMDAAALTQALDVITKVGRIAMAVVATAGTTDRGHIDPLSSIADACERADTWMHVDAAYGGGLLVSRTRRTLLDGIERARSVTVDFHKSFFQPVSSSALIVRVAADLSAVTWHADYLNPVENLEPNQVDKSMQTTRRFDALKLWTTLRSLGADTIGDLFDRTIDTTALVHSAVIDDADFALVSGTDLSTVLFRYQPDAMTDSDADALVPLIRRVLFDSGRALVAKTVIDERPCLKLTLLNPDSSVDDITGVLELIRAAGSALVESALLLTGAGITGANSTGTDSTGTDFTGADFTCNDFTCNDEPAAATAVSR